MIENEEKSLKGLIFITTGRDLRNTATNKIDNGQWTIIRSQITLYGQKNFCPYPQLLNPAFDYVELTFQADEEGGISSASCASLACGYEDKALRANYRRKSFSIFNFQLTEAFGLTVQTQIIFN
jgi:hypothetical protein